MQLKPMKPKKLTEVEPELLSLVLDLLRKDKNANEIRDELASKYPESKFGRETPLKLIRQAIKEKLLVVRAKRHLELEANLVSTYELDEAHIVNSNIWTDVANQAADLLLKMVKQLVTSNKQTVRIGVAGGELLSQICKVFSHRLREEPDGLPREIVIHSLVAGYEIKDATHSFFHYFIDQDPPLPIKVKFAVLHAPGFVPSGKYQEIKELPVIADAFKQSIYIDIIISSLGAHWSAKNVDGKSHSRLKDLYTAISPEAIEELEKEGVVGDLLWIPFTKNSLNISTNYRMMTLFTPEQFPRLIESGKSVILVAAPCLVCKQDKGELLSIVLNHHLTYGKLMTHLVSHRQCAQKAIAYTKQTSQ